MMSIGTLLAYTLVAISVLILRYQPTVTVDTGMADEDDTDDLPEVNFMTVKPLFDSPWLKSIIALVALFCLTK